MKTVPPLAKQCDIRPLSISMPQSTSASALSMRASTFSMRTTSGWEMSITLNMPLNVWRVVFLPPTPTPAMTVFRHFDVEQFCLDKLLQENPATKMVTWAHA